MSRRWRLTFVVGLAALGLIALGHWQATRQGEGPTSDTVTAAAPAEARPFEGYQAPELEVVDFSGKRVALSDLRGLPVYLNFWATWCQYCRQEMPDIARAYREVGGRTKGKVVFLLVDVGEAPEVVRKFATRSIPGLPVVLDMSGRTAQRYLIQGYPTSFFIDADGVIKDKVVGALDGPGLRTRLQDLLK
ncbi:MAG: TlpA family protein disulfide reductase [Chitinophagales bacterium]